MSSKNFLVRLFSSIWRGLDGFRKILHLLLLVMLFLVFFGAIAGTSPILPQQAALTIQPTGPLVDQLDGDPYDRALAELLGDAPPQTLVQDVIDALAFAKNDDRVAAVHLELSSMGGAGLSKLRRIGAAIDDFRESGKPVIASADFFSQSAYHLAAHADELYMHPEGMVFLQGYGGFRTYYKDAIDTLRLDWNVFRVGTHKSFVEPYTRMDMSPEDRESRTRLVGQFWTMYQQDIEAARGIPEGTIDDFAQNLVTHVAAAGGDIAIAAQEAGLIDQLVSHGELRSVLKGYAGEDADDSTDYSSVHSKDYLANMRLLHSDEVKDENVATAVSDAFVLVGKKIAAVEGSPKFCVLFALGVAGLDEHSMVLALNLGERVADALKKLRVRRQDRAV